MQRCPWCGTDPIYVAYHDEEWGLPAHDDRHLFEMIAFMVARLLQPRHILVGWGLGSVMRLIALVLYGVIVAKLWQAPVMAALLSFTAFLFVTTVVEPLFLKR